MSRPLFEANVLPVLKEVTDTFTQRGTEYGDTWLNCRWLALKATFGAIGIGRVHLTDDELRAIAAAVLVDVKYSRLEGPFKEDTVIDLIAYAPNWLAQMRKVDITNQLEDDEDVYPGDKERQAYGAFNVPI